MNCLNVELNHTIFSTLRSYGTMHFRTSVDIGIEIMEYLEDTPLVLQSLLYHQCTRGKGKTPMLPQYSISQGRDTVTIRTWEGEIIQYPNKDADINFGD